MKGGVTGIRGKTTVIQKTNTYRLLIDPVGQKRRPPLLDGHHWFRMIAAEVYSAFVEVKGHQSDRSRRFHKQRFIDKSSVSALLVGNFCYSSIYSPKAEKSVLTFTLAIMENSQ